MRTGAREGSDIPTCEGPRAVRQAQHVQTANRGVSCTPRPPQKTRTKANAHTEPPQAAERLARSDGARPAPSRPLQEREAVSRERGGTGRSGSSSRDISHAPRPDGCAGRYPDGVVYGGTANGKRGAGSGRANERKGRRVQTAPVRRAAGSSRCGSAMPSRPEDYEVLLTIGAGSYGKCRKVRRKADGKVRRRPGAPGSGGSTDGSSSCL